MRGFIRFRTLLWLIALAAVGIVAIGYGRAYILYYRIDQETHEMANSIISGQANERKAVQEFISDVQRRCNIVVDREDIDVQQSRLDQSVTAVIRVNLPIHFLVIDKTIYKRALVKITEKRLTEY